MTLLAAQIASIVCTVAIAILTGSIAGWLVSAVNPAGHRLSAAQLFDDGVYWQVRSWCRKHRPCGTANLCYPDTAATSHAHSIHAVHIGSTKKRGSSNTGCLVILPCAMRAVDPDEHPHYAQHAGIPHLRAFRC